MTHKQVSVIPELHLPVERRWFDLTASGEKTEDYRKITEYWIRRLTRCSIDFTTAREELQKGERQLVQVYPRDLPCPDHFFPRTFGINVVTLGYPPAGDRTKRLLFEHHGIRIRTGHPAWGATPDELYFVILHGKRIG